jgi:alanyl-tRNA synthetase
MDITSQLLHFTDPLYLEFEAQVLETLDLPDNRLGVVLDRTYFYPTGGGQEHDTGRLGEASVIDVYKDEERGVVVHVVDRPPTTGLVTATGLVSASIDRPRRLRHMQHHTAQHLLSHCCVQLLGLETVSANINGDTPSTLDLAGGEPGMDELMQVETLANQVIAEDRPVRTYFVPPDQLHTIPLRKPPKVSEDIRIVEIAGLDYSACGGTHVSTTGGIGVVKILRAERVKDKTRLHFIAGSRAVEYFQQLHEIVSGLAGAMSVHPGELPAAVQRQADQLKTAQRELGRLQAEMLVAEAEKLYAQAEVHGDRRLVLAAFTGRTLNDLRSLAKELRAMPGVVAVLASVDAASPPPYPVQVVIACSPGSGLRAQDLLRLLLSQIDGKGGGDASLAQGGGMVAHRDVTKLLSAARALIVTPDP